MRSNPRLPLEALQPLDDMLGKLSRNEITELKVTNFISDFFWLTIVLNIFFGWNPSYGTSHRNPHGEERAAEETLSEVNRLLPYLSQTQGRVGDCMTLLTHALAHNTSLLSLDFSGVKNVTQENFFELLMMLVKNNTLTSLDLSCNFTFDISFHDIADMLEKNSSLTSLKLFSSHPTDREDLKYLTEVIEKNTSLTQFDYNKIICLDFDAKVTPPSYTDALFKQIHTSLEENKQIKIKKKNDVITLAFLLLQGVYQGKFPFELALNIFLLVTKDLKLQPKESLIEKANNMKKSMEVVYTECQEQPHYLKTKHYCSSQSSLWAKQPKEDSEFLETRSKLSAKKFE